MPVMCGAGAGRRASETDPGETWSTHPGLRPPRSSGNSNKHAKSPRSSGGAERRGVLRQGVRRAGCVLRIGNPAPKANFPLRVPA